MTPATRQPRIECVVAGRDRLGEVYAGPNDECLESPLSTVWPAGMLDRINAP